jgi:hypothetical protein
VAFEARFSRQIERRLARLRVLLERNFPHSYALFTVQRSQISGSMKLNEKVQMLPESELIQMHQAAAEVAAQAPRFKAKLNGQN